MKQVLKDIFEVNMKLDDLNITKEERGELYKELKTLENQVEELELECFYMIHIIPFLKNFNIFQK